MFAVLLLLTPAAPFPQPSYIAPTKTVTIDVARLVAMPTKPDFDEVLIPLRAAQAETTRVEAARRDAEAQEQQREAEAAKAAVAVPAQARAVSGSCMDWIAAAGITDVRNALYVIGRESSCDPWAVNASSGACGIGQALPCNKMACAMGDGACQVRWMASYVLERYGSWANAASHSRSYGWY